MDKRFEYWMSIRDSVHNKLQQQQGKDLITFCLEELNGCEKLYGLMFIFTEFGEPSEEEKELLLKSNSLIIGDTIGFDDEFINHMVDTSIDLFYTFDKLDTGYLVNHNFEEMERYLLMRDNAIKENLN